VTKEEVMTAIKECAEKLGHAPSLSEVLALTRVTKRAIRKHFCNYTMALRECGMERTGAGFRLSMEALCRSWVEVARRLRRVPTVAEYEMHSRHNIRGLTRCFRSWNQVPKGVTEYAAKAGLEGEWGDVIEIISKHKERRRTLATPSGTPAGTPSTSKMLINQSISDQTIYGMPLMQGALLLAPTNEAGVMFLFASMARELGYAAIKIQTEFPDCEALRKVDRERCQRVRIEFEYESRNFREHQHAVNGCDMIVCWRHNWPECPLEVLEMRSLLPELP